MCYQFAGFELLTNEWLTTLAAVGTLVATVWLASIANSFQKQQAATENQAKAERQQIQIDRVLHRLRHSEVLLTSMHKALVEEVSAEHRSFGLALLAARTMHDVLAKLSFTDAELEALGPSRSFELIDLQSTAEIHRMSLLELMRFCQEEVDKKSETNGDRITFVTSSLDDALDIAERVRTIYGKLSQPH